MKKTFFVAKTEFVETFRQTQILLIAFFLVILYESILSPMKALCAETSMSLHFSEPFILLCTKSTNIILIPLIYLFLLSRFPYCKKQYFQMIRTGKQQWFFGELIFIAVSSFALTFIIFLGSMLFMTEQIKLQDNWSSFMTQMFEQYPKKYAENILLFINTATIAHGEPIEILIYTFVMMWGYLALCGTGMLLGTIIGHRIIAFIADAAVTTAGGMCTYIPGQLKWVFPLVHIEYGEHYNYVFSEIYFPVWGSITYYLLLTAIIIVLCLYKLKK